MGLPPEVLLRNTIRLPVVAGAGRGLAGALVPPPDTRHKARGLGTLAFPFTEIPGVAQVACIGNTNIRSELPGKVVSQPESQANIVDTAANAPFLDITEGNQGFPPALQNEPLGQ